tara:strand:- start:699 stop:908 length:210 start_codon:yes stop_codon:yes gene_type:complete
MKTKYIIYNTLKRGYYNASNGVHQKHGTMDCTWYDTEANALTVIEDLVACDSKIYQVHKMLMDDDQNNW